MNNTSLDIARDQVKMFWGAVGTDPSLIKYPITFRRLKQRIERRLGLSVLEFEPLTSGRVEHFLKENDLWNSQLLNTDPENSDLAGALFAVANAGIIFVRKDEQPPARKLFSLAHELGHYFIEVYLRFGQGTTYALFNRDAIGSVSRTAGGSLSEESFKEFKANQFAAELLMPRNLVLSLFGKIQKRRKKGVPQEVFVEQLMKAFGVSQRAAQVRIRDLGVECS